MFIFIVFFGIFSFQLLIKTGTDKQKNFILIFKFDILCHL